MSKSEVKDEKGHVGVNTVHAEALIKERIKKEMRVYRLNERFVVTESFGKGLVFSDKPTNISVADRGQEKSVADGGQVADADYLRIVAHKALAPAQKWDEPITTTMEYGWFSQQLCPENTIPGTLFHHPRVATEISKIYGASLAAAAKMEQA